MAHFSLGELSPSFNDTTNSGLQRAAFCTGPAIKSTPDNLLSEVIGTFILILGVLFLIAPTNSLGGLDALPVALLVLGIGLSIGGTTGYAINPARDLGPRIMHSLLPMKGKGGSDWKYSWIPVVGPIIGVCLQHSVISWFNRNSVFASNGVTTFNATTRNR